ncbi:hypothetical protein FISHEDRAFT_72481 [Fistulina hepatica ATCC 64428]|uniref:DUF1308 domain-containing protein n=1 Tax=Fistulina hepatica ATCC 64428 TaxID=1128425 RepID=A0A0D7AFD8_9AGAR|nr:hypothetical protein FISHEDRAFT_72481 [Fistulina hepatica ATCC 64428]
MSVHANLRELRKQLDDVHQSLLHFYPPAIRLPILDSSLDFLAGPDDTQWVLQDHIPGLKKLKDAIHIDLEILDKFFENPDTERLQPPSTNAPYLLSVWNEILCAPPPIVAIFKSIPLLAPKRPSNGEKRRREDRKPPGTKVDVIADNGCAWIRVNTIKNSRILAEFREIDSYITSDDESDDEAGEDYRPSLRQGEFDNSILKMGRSLADIAKANAVEGALPKVTLRLTRLDPGGPDSNTEPRIQQTTDMLKEMGLCVELGERSPAEIPPAPLHHQATPEELTIDLQPTTRINLDLSVVIALASDLTHAALPTSVEEAQKRFVPPVEYREWRKSHKEKIAVLHRRTTDSSAAIIDGLEGFDEDLSKHTRQLTSQVLQEMRKGLIDEMRERTSTLPDVEFWTTQEARDRCLRIIDKIGGPQEKRRTSAMFAANDVDLATREEMYWRDSRYPARHIPLLPIRVLPACRPTALDSGDNADAASPFFEHLAQTCEDVLSDDVVPYPRSARYNASHRVTAQLSDDEDELPASATTAASGATRPGRAHVTRSNPKLTAHTVESMLHGVRRGWTTLTANKTSVKGLVSEMKVRRPLTPRKDVLAAADSGAKQNAAIWIVDPRSLAESMRSDIPK